MAHLLSSFIERPARTHFETQQAGEEIILLLRAHPITNLRWIIIGIVLILTPFFLFLAAPLVLGLPVSSATVQQFFIIFSIVWELIAFGYIFEQFLNYYFSVYIVTNLRVVDIDFINLLSKVVSDAQLDDIEDITYNQNGILRSIFNYGDIIIQTAGAKQEFDFYAVPRPDDVAQIISELQPRGDNE